MQIAYLNPWENAAENQAYASLAIAAKRKGHNLIDCRTAEDVESIDPVFVLSVASSVPKVVDRPTYLTLHEPKKRFLESSFYFRNFLTYDGYVTISDSLAKFAQHVAAGVGRSTKIGFYYNTPQQSSLRTNISSIVEQSALRLVYLGTNWDKRMPQLFQALDKSTILKIHGPEPSWQNEGYSGYAGALPFDGISPQKAYSGAGMGLVLLSADHLREDVISNRIFEITSAGAVAVCPDTPWIRKWFGDSVLYFEPYASPLKIARQIKEHHRFCSDAPAEAQAMADAARNIFEEHFAADRMIENVVAFHEERSAASAASIGTSNVPLISVVVRCGSRSVDAVQQAVESIKRQTYGRFTVIFSKFRPIDLSAITDRPSGAVDRYIEIMTDGGNRAETLSAGLRRVDTPYFAVLDDDDFWLSNHMETLFAAAEIVDSDFDLAFSGTVAITRDRLQIEKSLAWNRNVSAFGLTKTQQITSSVSSNCFVARTAALENCPADLGGLNTAEDSLLISLLARRKPPVFSYRATAFFRRGFAGESNFESRDDRAEDELAWVLRAHLLYSPRWLPTAAIDVPMETWLDVRSKLLASDTHTRDLSPIFNLESTLLEDAQAWNVTSLLILGASATRSERGILVSSTAAHFAAYGPYVRLPAGSYIAEVVIDHVQLPFWKRSSRRMIGEVDVTSVDPHWIGGSEAFYDNGTVRIPFTVPASFPGKIEFRVFSMGMARFTIRSVTILQPFEN